MRRRGVIAAAAVAGVLALGGGMLGSSQGGGVNVWVGNDTVPTPTATATPTATPDPGVANLWVDTTGGTCTRQGTAGAYSDGAACATFDNAWDAATAGDTIRVKNGTYAHQCVTGDKASDTKIIGESKAGVIVNPDGVECVAQFGGESTIGVTGTHAWLQDMTLDSGTSTAVGIGVRIWPGGDDATMVNVDLNGDFAALYIEGDNFEWHGGVLRDKANPAQMTCTNGASLPLWVWAPNTVIDGVTFGIANRVDTPTPNVGTCGGDGIPHIETVRPEDGAENLTIENSWFKPNSEIGSGHIFSSAAIAGLKLVNNVFGISGDNPMILQMGSLGATGTKFLYNTFPAGSYSNATSNFPIVGNIIDGSDMCGNQNVLNLRSGSGSCGTDTYVGATSLGVNADGTLAPTSPAIDAAETPGASDYCTGADVGSVDFQGDTRPSGSVCDAGADELTP